MVCEHETHAFPLPDCATSVESIHRSKCTYHVSRWWSGMKSNALDAPGIYWVSESKTGQHQRVFHVTRRGPSSHGS